MDIVDRLSEEGSELSLEAAKVIKKLRQNNSKLQRDLSKVQTTYVQLRHEHYESVIGGYEKL